MREAVTGRASTTARGRVALAGLALVLLFPPSASGHAAFLDSAPDAGQRLESAPRRVTMSFTEPLNQRLSWLKLVPARAGDPVAARVAQAGSKELALEPLAPLQDGSYVVRWHTVSTLDGHALEGTFSFGVRAAPAAGEHALEQSPLARGGWLRVGFRTLMYAALLAFAGALLLGVLLRDRPGRSWLVPPAAGRLLGADALESLRARERDIVADLGAVAAGSAAAVAVLDAVDAAGDWSIARLRDYLLGSPAGFARVAVVLLVLVAGILWLRGLRRSAAAAAAVALGAIAISGHASSAAPRAASVVTDWVHLLAGAVWIGGIALILAVWWRSLGRRELRGLVTRSVLPLFGAVALPAFLVVAVTGVASSVIELGRVSALWETGYGLTLAAKSVLVLVLAGVSYIQAMRLRPRLLAANPHPDERFERRHWRLLRAEPVVGAAILLAAALLATFPLPPRQLGETGEAAAATTVCDPCPLPAPGDSQLAVAERAGRHVVAAWIRRDAGRLEGEVRAIGFDEKAARAPLSIPGAATRSCGRGCLRFRAPASDLLRVAVRDRGRIHTAELPARWRRGEEAWARRTLERAERAMRRLRSVREIERVSSGPGSFARTEFRLEAPDRMAFRTNLGAARVEIGRRSWMRAPGVGWQPNPADNPAPFVMRSWFRWTPYAHTVRLLEVRHRTAELAVMDPATPVWIRLTVALDTMRVPRVRVVAKGHFATQRYFAFNRPVTIEPPIDDAG